MENFSPKKIVTELNRYIVGQEDAKKAVAIALRNRWRRRQVEDEWLKEEITPKNILMIGPTGVGKTEIARRIAKLTNAPFIKIEATKFTEVGYVGRDVDSIVRDLVEIAVTLVREKLRKEVRRKAKDRAESRILDSLVGQNANAETRDKFRKMMREGKLDEKEIEVEIQDNGSAGFSNVDIPGVPGGQMGVLNIGDILGKAMGGRMKNKHLSVKEAYEIILAEESDKLIDEERIIKESIELTENDGIVFLDEMDKVAARADSRSGDVSREGVQRDLLPLLEGTTVATKYGAVKTDHILFICSGAFHMSKPSDLLPELQGRLPIRVELKALARDDLTRILKEPEASLPVQYKALMATDGVDVTFSDKALKQIATIAADVNESIENIGARRLHTIMEKLMEDISFKAGDGSMKKVSIDEKYVKQYLNDISKDTDLSRFIL